MTQRNNLTAQSIHSIPLIKLMLPGAGIGLLLISVFVFGVDEPKPEWGKLWMIKPLILTPLIGATGGVFYYFMDHLRYQGGWRKILANMLSLFAFIIILWLGIVLGLNGTMWD